MSDFDRVITRDRRSRKYGQLKAMFGTEDVLPMWIADMEFTTPEPVLHTLREVVSQPVQGYNMEHPQWRQSVCGWYKKRYDISIDEAWLHFVPGVIKTIVLSIMALTEKGDTILTCTPVYDPYPNLIKTSGRNLVQTRLVEKNGIYELDWHDFREKVKTCKMFLFSSPHNPGGIVWDRATLEEINRCCHQADVIVVSDEVHCDLTLPPQQHIPFFTLSASSNCKSIVFTSISKAFNTPAIQGGIALIKNDALRNTFYHFLDNCYLAETNSIQQAAIYSAYTHCDSWIEKLLSYLAANVAYVKQEIEKNCPLLSVIYGGASYLVFLNAQKMGLSDAQLMSFFVHNARLGLSAGIQYGPGGEGHMRLNIACPRSQLEESMKRLKAAYESCGFLLHK